jgi:dTDP-4-dehydrorhamnose reductase
LGEPIDYATVIRTSIIGDEPQCTNNYSLIEWVKQNKNGIIYGYINHYWNGITCLTLAKIMYEIIAKKQYWRGIKHIYSPFISSKLDICSFVNEIYGLNIKINVKHLLHSTNMSLTSNNPYRMTIPSIKEQIKEQYYFLNNNYSYLPTPNTIRPKPIKKCPI